MARDSGAFLLDRRRFLGTMTAAVLATRSRWAPKNRKIGPIGMQLITVHAAMEQDFDGTLARIAAIGYREVEFAGYFHRSPKEVRATLDRYGLTSPSTHVDYKSLTGKWSELVDASKLIGHKYIVNSWIDEEVRDQVDGWHRAAETFNRAGEACRKAGIQFAYHNHWFEFRQTNGESPYDLLLRECDPILVKMEMDLCWTAVGGQDPVAYFDRDPGRFPLVHVKDLERIPTSDDPRTAEWMLADIADVGSGVIDWKRIFSHADRAGIKHYFVEHDRPRSPFDSLKNSYEYLRRLRF